MPHVFLRRAEVQRRFGNIGRSTIYDQIRDGLLPRPTPIGAQAVGWLESRIDSIIAARLAGKSDVEIKALVADMNAGRDLNQMAA